MSSARPRAGRAGLASHSARFWARLAVGLAMLVTLLSATDAPFFRTDERTLSTFDPESALLGAPSASVARLFWVLPIGNLAHRSTLLGACAAAVAAFALVHLTFRAASSIDLGARTLGPLSVSAALVVVLGPAWLSESTSIAGGAAPAAALGLVALLALERLSSDHASPANAGSSDSFAVTRAGGAGHFWGAPARNDVWQNAALGRRIVWALLLGLTLTESPWITLGLVLVSLGATHDRVPFVTRLSVLGAALLVPAILLTAKTTRFGVGAFGSLELLADGATLPLLDPRTAVLAPGVFVLVGTCLALFTSRPSERAVFVGLGLFALDALVPNAPSSSWITSTSAAPARDALHLLALATLAPLAALGFSRLGALAARLRLPAARQSTAVGLVLALATAAASIEDSTRTLESTASGGAARFTAEALEQLPARALVLVRSKVLGKRLLAAQATGARPDVLVVPEDDLARPGTIEAWLAREPRLELFVRDTSLGHGASEHALAELLASRPVYVEPNGAWQRRLLEHVAPDMPLARVSPHALTRSERLAAVQLGKERLERIRAAATKGLVSDAATLDMIDRVRTTTEDVTRRLGDPAATELLTAHAPSSEPALLAPRVLAPEGS